MRLHFDSDNYMMFIPSSYDPEGDESDEDITSDGHCLDWDDDPVQFAANLRAAADALETMAKDPAIRVIRVDID